MSKLEILNRIVQIFFFRVAQVQENGREWYALLLFVYPFTGWSTNFRFVGGKHKLLQVWPSKPVKNHHH